MSLVKDPLVGKVIGCAIEVHRHLGPGLLESTYRRCLTHEFAIRRIRFVAEQSLPVKYKDLQLDCGYRIDVVVENRLILELKAVERLLPVHQAQLMTYLRLLDIRQGLLINFSASRLVEGVKSLLLPEAKVHMKQ